MRYQVLAGRAFTEEDIATLAEHNLLGKDMSLLGVALLLDGSLMVRIDRDIDARGLKDERQRIEGVLRQFLREPLGDVHFQWIGN